MPQPPVTVSKSGPGFAQVLKDMRRLQKCDVLVGIPAEKAPRKDGGINSAALLYLHAHGSELMLHLYGDVRAPLTPEESKQREQEMY